MKKAVFYVGTYSEHNEESIYLYEANFEKGEFTKIHSHIGTPNPSYLLESSLGVLYAVEEMAEGSHISSFIVDDEGFSKKSKLSAYGKDPCHLELNDEEDLLFVANYSSGSLASFKLNQDGMLADLWDLKEHQGSGVNHERQEAPHVHGTKFINGCIYACDLGLDKVFCYRVDRGKEKLMTTEGNLRVPDGHGPRHICLHPNNEALMYVVAELTAEVFVFERHCHKYEEKQCIHSLPDGVPENNRAAAIKCSKDGKYLYVSNRGNDSLTAFAIDNHGLLKVLDVAATGAKEPRDFVPFGDYMVIANQESSLLTVLHFDRINERFEKMSMEETVGHPVCITERLVNLKEMQ